MNIDPALLDLLKDYKDQGVSFYDTKQQLLAKGYTDEQITFASAHNIPDVRPVKSPVHAALAENPEAAKETAKLLLLGDLQKRQRRIIGFDTDGLLGLFNSQSRGESFSLLRLPLGIIFIGGLIVGAVLWWMANVLHYLPDNTVDIFLLVFFVGVAGLVVYRMVTLDRSIGKLAHETGAPHRPHIIMNILFVLLVLGAVYMVATVLL